MNNKLHHRFAISAAALLFPAFFAAPAPAQKPNIILIISDDHGFPDYGFMGHPKVCTPNLDRMALEGLLYTRGYAMPVSFPSVASLLTGLYPSRHGITGNDLIGRPRRVLADRLLDNTCGELDRILDEKDLTRNTMVIYIADNGWEAEGGSRAGTSKLTPYELGIRTPIFVRWPEKVAPLRDDETLAFIIDIVPTIMHAAGLQVETPLPGLDLLDREAMTGRSTVFVEAYTHDIAELDAPEKSMVAGVVLDGWHKLIIPGEANPDRIEFRVPAAPELYDLKNDPLEKRDIAAERPEEVQRLTVLWKDFWKKK